MFETTIVRSLLSFLAALCLWGCASDPNSTDEGASSADNGSLSSAQEAAFGQRCTPGQRRCLGNATELCGSNGQWGPPVACSSGCSNGVCACTAGLTSCNGTCVTLASNPANCGACGHACATGQNCLTGICCNSNQTNCGGTCATTATDPTNCGTCGAKCNAGTTCRNSACTQCIPNASCGTASQCKATGTCNATGATCIQPAVANNTVCTSPKSGVCSNGNCSCYQGQPSTCLSGQGTTCTSWSFESNTLEGWAVDTADPNNTAFVTNLGVSAAPAGGTAGTRALSFHYRPAGGTSAVLSVPLCDSHGVQFNATANTFTFSLFFVDDPTSTTVEQAGFQAFQVFHAPTFSQVITAGPTSTIRSGAWLTYNTQLFAGETDLENAVGITFFFAGPWSGTVFVDNVHF